MEREKHDRQISTATVTPVRDEYARIAQEYELPNAVKRKLEADIQQAQSIAIVITLLAGTLVTLTSILGGTNTMLEDNNTRGWSAFRVILWTAIMSDVAEAIICIMAIKMCSELPLVAMEKAMERLDQSEGLSPEEVERKNAPASIGLKEIKARYAILETVGMPHSYRHIDRLVIWFLLWAVAMSFLTMFFWVCHTIIIIPAGLIIMFFVFISAMLIVVFVIAMGFARHWSERKALRSAQLDRLHARLGS